MHHLADMDMVILITLYITFQHGIYKSIDDIKYAYTYY